MSKINVCPACNADAHGVKSRIAFEHTCGKGELNREQFENIANAIREQSAPEWQQADTGCYLLLRILFGDAQRYAMAYGVAINTGIGKTFTSERYAAQNEEAIYIKCEETLTRRLLVIAILKALSIAPKGSAEKMQGDVIEALEKVKEPLLIIDDAQMLKDRVLHFVISLYKRLINHCGIVILGNDELRNKVVEGARMQRFSICDEVYNTIGRRFVALGQLGPRDVELVCKANGIAEADVIDDIKDLSKGSLHNTTSLIKQYKAEGRL